VLGEGEPTNYLVRELTNLRARLSASLDSARFEGKPHDDSAHAAALGCLSLAGRNEWGTTLTDEEVRAREEIADARDSGRVLDCRPGDELLNERLTLRRVRRLFHLPTE
jgi:hypothetical protein